jgi:antitoxin (DNA-binding transcriptional repressor) of toxin-antitoxin stability system
MIVKMHQAKTQLSKLIAAALAGEEVFIARGDTPVVKLSPIEPAPQKKRQFGRYKGMFELPDSFFDPLPDEDLTLWEGRDDPEDGG